MKTGPRTKWLIDAALLANFLLAFWLNLTGVALHQWLGVSLAALAGYHLVVHWEWVKSVTRRLFGKTSEQARIYYLIDAGVMFGFIAIMLSGLFISTWFNLSLPAYEIWRGLHVAVSVTTLFLVVMKVALHWRWILEAARRFVFAAPRPAQAAAATPLGRRDFLKLMSVVGGAAVVALSGVWDGGAENLVSAQATDANQTSASASGAAASTKSTTSSCYVRCNRRCSYPGRCRRYVDRHGNGRCDLGECL